MIDIKNNAMLGYMTQVMEDPPRAMSRSRMPLGSSLALSKSAKAVMLLYVVYGEEQVPPRRLPMFFVCMRVTVCVCVGDTVGWMCFEVTRVTKMEDEKAK